MKAKFVWLLIINILLTGCNKNESIYEIETDIGTVINEAMQQELKNTAHIVLETEDSTISINDNGDINKIINTLIHAKTIISEDITWEKSLLWVHLYDEEKTLITSVNIYITISNSEKYSYAKFVNEDNKNENIIEDYYYIENETLKKILDKYS